MKKINIILGALMAMVLLYSCSKEEDEVCPPGVEMDSLTFSFNATTNGLPLEFRKEFTDPLGRKMSVELFKTYISNISLDMGSEKSKVLDAALIIFEDNGKLDPDDLEQRVTVLAPVGNYTGISLSIGLNSDQNNSNPTAYDNDHPLSIQRNTYWSTWSKYKFLMIEGRLDINNNGDLTDTYSYHTGLDECYREKSINKAFSVEKGKANTLDFTIEVNDLFFGNDTINLALEPFWHGDTTLIDRGLRLSDNAKDALMLE